MFTIYGCEKAFESFELPFKWKRGHSYSQPTTHIIDYHHLVYVIMITANKSARSFFSLSLFLCLLLVYIEESTVKILLVC